MSKERMQEFKQKIKAMLRTKEQEEQSKGATYGDTDINIVRDTNSGKIWICTKEVVAKNEEKYRITVGSNHIGSEEQMAEYHLQSLPAGRVCFGGYTHKEVNQNKELYRFSDVWYKLYGTPLQMDRKFAKENLLALEPQIEEKWKEAKFSQIYAITCKDQSRKKKLFEGTKYFASCQEGEEIPHFEMIDDENSEIQIRGNARNGRITLIIEGQKIDIEDLCLGSQIVRAKKSEFTIEVIEEIGRSRVYTQAKYTKEACKQIVEQYEREQDAMSL